MDEYLMPFKGRFAKIEDVFEYANADENLQDSIRMKITRILKSEQIFRAGRGLYGFFYKPSFTPNPNEQLEKLSGILQEKFPYLEIVITDTSFLAGFMNLQPFATVILLETKESAIEPVIATLQRSGITAFAQKDYSKIEKYAKKSVIIVLRPAMAINPAPIQKGKLKFASLEKVLVDLVCDDNIFSQYQDVELENIYKNATAKYAINYSKLLKYANARNRKDKCMLLLETTEEFKKVRNLL